MTKLHVLICMDWGSWSKTWILLRVLASLLNFGVKVKNFYDCLRMVFVVFFCDRGCCKEFGPFLGQTNKAPIDWVKPNMHSVRKVSRVTDTTHGGTAAIDCVDPLI